MGGTCTVMRDMAKRRPITDTMAVNFYWRRLCEPIRHFAPETCMALIARYLEFDDAFAKEAYETGLWIIPPSDIEESTVFHILKFRAALSLGLSKRRVFFVEFRRLETAPVRYTWPPVYIEDWVYRSGLLGAGIEEVRHREELQTIRTPRGYTNMIQVSSRLPVGITTGDIVIICVHHRLGNEHAKLSSLTANGVRVVVFLFNRHPIPVWQMDRLNVKVYNDGRASVREDPTNPDREVTCIPRWEVWDVPGVNRA